MILEGRGVSKGKVEGEVVKVDRRVSFLGDADPETGKVFEDVDIRDKIFVFPGGRGSTVGSYVIYQLKKNGYASLGMINESTETIVASGAIISDIPLVDQIEIDLLKMGDEVELDGKEGTVELKDVIQQPVVTAFLKKEDNILLLKRGEDVGSYHGQWSAVSGYLEEKSPLEQARKEIEEETGITEADLITEGKPVRVRYQDKVWEVNPFIFEVKEDKIDLNWENVECRWVRPEEIKEMDTVPRLWDAYRSARDRK